MPPISSKARHLASVIGLIKSGGRFCIICVVLTGCLVTGWKHMGKDVADYLIKGMERATDTAIAQARANEAALKTVEVAARTADRFTEALRTSHVESK